jgi:protoheme IX farnesyltransferase
MHLAPTQGHSFLEQGVIIIGIFFIASSGAVANHIFDKDIDKKMRRTAHRPLAQGSLPLRHAFLGGILLLSLGTAILLYYANILTWLLTCMGAIGYGLIYTVFLKKSSPQNIVWGGLSGALPPLLGWVSMRNQIDPQALLLVALIFVWTPPHFWALALHKQEEYRHAQIPMLPVTHGNWYTTFSIIAYTVLLIPVCIFIWLSNLCSIFFLGTSLFLTMIYLSINMMVYKNSRRYALMSFQYSIMYLYLIFFCMIIDPWIRTF